MIRIIPIFTKVTFVVLVFTALLRSIATFAAPLYDYHVISHTGDVDSSGNTISTFHAESVSINDTGTSVCSPRCEGTVAFVATNNLGQSLYISDGTSDPAIISFLTPSSSRTYHNGVQINNNNQVIVRDRSGSTSLIRIWEGNSPGTFTTIVRGNISGGTSTFPAAYSSVLSHPTLSNIPLFGTAPFVAFSALDIDLTLPDTVLATPNTLGVTNRFNFNEIQIETPLRPMIADSGQIVLRAGGLDNDPIHLYSYDLSESRVIADSSKFSRLGRSPGVSDDGRIIAFYGELTTAGAAALGLQSGPGIFASVESLCVSPGLNGVLDSAVSGDDETSPIAVRGGPDGQCNTAKSGDDRQVTDAGSPSRQIIRVAGIRDNGILDPGEPCSDLNMNGLCESDEDLGKISSFNPDSRISASNVGTVSFIAFDASSNKGLYASHLEFIRINPINTGRVAVTGAPRIVAQVGQTISSVGTIADISVYDPINNQNRGKVAFWTSTTGGNQAIVRATPNCSDDNYVDPLENPYINQYNAGIALDLPKSPDGVSGGNSCGPSSLSMLLNSYKLANFKPTRAVLWDKDDPYSSVYGNTALYRPIPPAAIPSYNLFSFVYARSWVVGLGYTATETKAFTSPFPTVATTKAWIDDKLAAGIPVLVSTTFSSKARNSPNPYGGGHIILLIGRTFSGDYIVKDPAGDYYAGADNAKDHYGLGKSCGGNAVYSELDVEARLAKRIKGGGLETPDNMTTTDISAAKARPAIAIPASVDPDPVGLAVTGRSSSTVTRPYYLWIEDGNGRITGWIPDGTRLEEIPNSTASLNPIIPSDPDSTDDNLVPDQAWPYAISVDSAGSNFKVVVQAVDDTDFSVDSVWFVDGSSTTVTDAGTLTAGEVREIDITQPSAGLLGDLDGDIDVDRDDLNIIRANLNQPAASPSDPMDINGDGTISVRDMRALVPSCSRPRCATE